jgi:hypothetical protein
MEQIILSQYSLKDIATEITNQLFTKLKEDTASPQKLLNSAEVAKHFGISKLTLQHWRNAGTIKFTKIGAKVFYKTEDIQALLTSKNA